jgi:hypothetical protein
MIIGICKTGKALINLKPLPALQAILKIGTLNVHVSAQSIDIHTRPLLHCCCCDYGVVVVYLV